jgi:23S rRNA U2552 (ribose-2'-O)-methylase RlmE/FtsJ
VPGQRDRQQVYRRGAKVLRHGMLPGAHIHVYQRHAAQLSVLRADRQEAKPHAGVRVNRRGRVV